eukprot:Gb_36227 [translate_table: standard]
MAEDSQIDALTLQDLTTESEPVPETEETSPESHATVEPQKTAAASDHAPTKPELTLEEKFNLVRSVGEECIQEDELWNLLEKKKDPICYDGFEPSGRMHIAQWAAVLGSAG